MLGILVYYKIFVNGVFLATVGHPNVRNMSLSLLIVSEGPMIFAEAVCEEEGDLYLIAWFHNHSVLTSDVVEFKAANEGPVREPIKKYKMRPANT